MIERILPPSVIATEAFGDDPAAELLPEEHAVIARAVEGRQREFATARSCARSALASLGVPPAPLLPGLRGAPRWPAGVAGSITHCDGYRAAAVAYTKDVRSLGIDAEPGEPLPDDGMLGLIASEAERARLADLAVVAPGICWDRLLFCAKESVYKTWFPLAHRWLGFEQADVVFDPDADGFTAQVLVPGPFSSLRGRWLAAQGLLITTIVLPALPREDLP
jgi:4'-phosphopantetheinyl transferase EntD